MTVLCAIRSRHSGARVRSIAIGCGVHTIDDLSLIDDIDDGAEDHSSNACGELEASRPRTPDQFREGCLAHAGNKSDSSFKQPDADMRHAPTAITHNSFCYYAVNTVFIFWAG